MTAKEAKTSIAMAIRNAVIGEKTEHLKMDKIKEVMEEKKINRTQLKATIRNGNAGFVLKEDDSDLSKTKAMNEKICAFIDENFEAPKKRTNSWRR